MFKELDRLKETRHKVSLHISESYSAIGHIIRVNHDCVELKETNYNGMNPYVIIPIDKIKYARPLK